MKKLILSFLITGLACLATDAVNAQIRYTNLKLDAVSPTAGTVIANGGTTPLKYTLTNMGPDSLKAGDTLYLTGNAYNIPSNQVAAVPLSGSIPPNASATLQFSAPNDVYTNNRTESTDTTLDLCAGIYTKFNVLDSTFNLRDTSLSNNKACVSVTLKGKPTSGIFDVNGEVVKATLYPNPAHDVVSIDFAMDRKATVTGRISDITGRQVYLKDYGLQKPGVNTYKMELKGLYPGTYLVEFISDNKKAVGRLVVQ